jgi:hypothetical protein
MKTCPLLVGCAISRAGVAVMPPEVTPTCGMSIILNYLRSTVNMEYSVKMVIASLHTTGRI